MNTPRIHETLDIPASLTTLDRVHAWTARLLERLHIPADDQHNILLAMSEAVTNAIRHGCGENDQLHVHIDFRGAEDGIDIAVTDCGCGFSPDGLPDPTNEAELTKPGGRGVFLLRSLARDVNFVFTDEGTTVTFRFGTH